MFAKNLEKIYNEKLKKYSKKYSKKFSKKYIRNISKINSKKF